MADDKITGQEFGKLQGEVEGLGKAMGAMRSDIKDGFRTVNDTMNGIVTGMASKGEVKEVRDASRNSVWKIVGLITGLAGTTAGFIFWIATRCC